VDVVDVVEASEAIEVDCLYFLLGGGVSLSMLSQWRRFPLREVMVVLGRAVSVCCGGR
jgi:hypothetical protein